ncbi:RNA polymerase sigma factor [Pseudomonas sp. PDM14]|nr:RNA polymerase sigma factor [Pseudomonas sp. PDM14]
MRRAGEPEVIGVKRAVGDQGNRAELLDRQRPRYSVWPGVENINGVSAGANADPFQLLSVLTYICRLLSLPSRSRIVSHATSKPSLVAVLARHYDELVDSVRRRFGDRHTAHEVVHDVCVQLLESPEKEGVRVPLALLRKITHDRAVSHYRSERRRLAWVDEQAQVPAIACAASSPESRHETDAEVERLCAAIASLPPRCQQVFVMHKIHELSQKEVAVQMGISLKAVEKHLRLGMHQCRLMLGYQATEA